MRIFAPLLLSLTITAAHAADVYRSVTEDGTVVFGDRPFSGNVDVVHVTVPKDPGAAAVPLTVAPVRSSLPVGNQPSAVEDEVTNAQIRQRIAENCDLAQRQLAFVRSTDDLLRTEADGTMRRLTAEEIVEARELAAAEVEEWCESPAAAGATP